MMEPAADRRLWRQVAILVAITTCAAFLRLYRIDSLPPADGYDAAYYGVDALQLLRGQPPRVMYPPNREPLFSYLLAVSFLAFGASTTTIHLTSALIGVLTIPAVYLVADELFKESDEPLRHWGAPLSALMMALSYWHLNWSRLGMRAILVPLLAATTVGLLWRGLRRARPGHFVMCGISLGLSLYTYQAARVLPILVVIGFSVRKWRRGSVSKRDWQQLIIVTVVSLLVFTPLGIHFLTHPGSFSRRIEEALILQPEQGASDNLQVVIDQACETWLAFSFVGDQTPYSTIPGRPSLNPFLSALLVLGIGISLSEIRKPSRVLLLAWFGLMTLPSVLAGSGPTAKRAIGTLPAVAILIARGALSPWTRPRHPLQRSRRWAERLRTAWIVILIGGFAYSGLVTYRDYFVVWASNPNLPKHFEADISSIGEYIGNLDPEEQVYLSPELPRHPSIRFHSDLRDDIRGYNGRVCFVAPNRTAVDTTYIIVTGEGDRSLDQLAARFPQGRRIGQSTSEDQATFIPYRIPAGAEAQVQPTQPLKATWADHIQLLGCDLGTDPHRPGGTISVALTYLDLRRMEKRYTAFVHLLGPVNPASGGLLWAQSDSEPCHGFYPTTSWHEGEILIDRVKLNVPEDAPTGTYRLATGFYDVWTGERLPLTSKIAPTENDILILGEVEIDVGR